MAGYRGRDFPSTVNVAATGGLKLAGTSVTATAAELNLLIQNEPVIIESIKSLIAKRIASSKKVNSGEELAGFNPIISSLQQLHQKLNPN